MEADDWTELLYEVKPIACNEDNEADSLEICRVGSPFVIASLLSTADD